MAAACDIQPQQIELSVSTQERLSFLATLYYGSLSKEYEDMITKFLNVEPWAAWPPLVWRKPPFREVTDTIFAKIALSPDLTERMHEMIALINRINRNTADFTEMTPRIFIYTAIVWWITYVYPLPESTPLKH